jgi:hypothetical protein
MNGISSFFKSFEPLAKLLKVREGRHSGQAKRDPESRILKQFWIPAFAGMTEEMTFARSSFLSDYRPERLIEDKGFVNFSAKVGLGEYALSMRFVPERKNFTFGEMYASIISCLRKS